MKQESHRDGDRDREEGIVAQGEVHARSLELAADLAGIGKPAPQELVEGRHPPRLVDPPQRRHLRGPRTRARAHLDVLQAVAQAALGKEAAEHQREGDEGEREAARDEDRHRHKIEVVTALPARHVIASISTLSRP